ncbi:MAG: hypothetical protein EOO01_38515, partial [Chitinophagaceae bacterium]
MMLKYLFILVFFVTCSSTFAQDSKPAFDGHNWQAPYALAMEGWGIERFRIPIEFAPGIKYNGIEDVRFTKGWGEVKSNEYWSYAFLWYLDGKPTINIPAIEKNLAMYYDGLIGQNVEQRKIPLALVKPTKVKVTKIATQNGDVATFSGTIEMLDYMQQNPAEFVDFNIPWQFSINYSFGYSSGFDPTLARFNNRTTSTASFNGSFSLTPKWNFSVSGYADLKTQKLENFNMAISREMHCWQMSITVTPIGYMRSFGFTISPKSGLLQDLRINRNRSFFTTR